MSAASLARLLEFLKQDPDNAVLRAEAFDAALAAGALDVADTLVHQALEKTDDRAGWKFRAATLALARKNWPAARAHLSALEAEAGPHPAITHNLAWADFCEGHFDAAAARLAPLANTEQVAPATQALWLRALHHAGRLDELLAWAREREGRGDFDDNARGVASLAAIDAEAFADAERWCAAALKTQPQNLEALVAAASLALGAQDAARAQDFARAALAIKPEDGRARSALAFAELLALDLSAARADFERALKTLPNHIGTWHGLGWACVMQHDIDAASSAFDAALALDHNFSETHGALAVVRALRGDVAGANQSIEIARRLDPRDLSSHYAEALMNGQASDAKALSRLAERLLKARGLTGFKP